MSLGDAWALTPGSSSKMNKVTIISGTGSYLAGLTKSNHTILVCTSTGSGFTLDHVYLCTNDGLSVIDISDVNEHTHVSSGTGGFFTGVLAGNVDVFDTGTYFTLEPYKAKWNTFTDNSATISDDNDGTTGEPSIKIDSGATNGSTGSINQRGLEMNVAQDSFFKTMQRFGTASSLAEKVGFGMESLNAVNNNRRKYGYEICTTVNNNFFITSADGTTRSSSDSGIAFNTSRTSYRVEHYPATPKIDMYINEGIVFTKTTNVPTTYLSDEPKPDEIFRVSFKNSTAASRTLFLYGCRFVYNGSNQWHNEV